MIRLFLAALFVFAVATPARAADAPQESVVPTEKESTQPQLEEMKEKAAAAEQKKIEENLPKGVKEHQQAAQDVFELTKKVAGDLSPEEQKHFFLLYNNYNLIGTVKMVQGDVTNAVKACGESNPDLKEKMDARFGIWGEAINPIIKDSEANVNNMVIAQDYAKEADIKKIFQGLDKTRKLANAQIEKTPVTTKDACEYLLDTMDDTQENFAQLLRSTLISAPQAAVPANAQEPEKEDVKEEEKKADDASESVEPSAGEKQAEEPKSH